MCYGSGEVEDGGDFVTRGCPRCSGRGWVKESVSQSLTSGVRVRRHDPKTNPEIQRVKDLIDKKFGVL
jgi:hypothetical protein